MSDNQKMQKNTGKFVYDPAQQEYECVVGRPYQWWWWLLLLLIPLLLLIRCERDVTVSVKDVEGNPIENVEVGTSYTAHYLWKGGLLTSEGVERYATTGSNGEAVLRDLPCSVFSYIFYAFSDMTVTANPPAKWSPAEKKCNFHYTWKVDFVLDDAPISVRIRVVDAIDGTPIEGADVYLTARGKSRGVSREDGIATLNDISPRKTISVGASKSGYATNDSSLRNLRVRLLTDSIPEIPLSKIYECDDDVTFSSTFQPKVVISDIDMHKNSGTFTLSCYTDAFPDRFVVLDANGKQLFDTGFFPTGPYEWVDFDGIKFNTRKITIEVYCDPDHPTSSVWSVRPHCPD